MGEEQSGGPTLREQIVDVVKEIMGTGTGTAEKKVEPADIETQVATAVERVRAGDAAARQRSALEERLAALEAKKPPEPEKIPRPELRKITKLMWGGDDDGQ